MLLIRIFSAIAIWFLTPPLLTEPAKITWMTLEQAEQAAIREPRPILVDLYTDWCGWCKVMDKKTYANNKVAEYLSARFYNVKLNAESREAFTWAGRKYTFNDRYNANDIALFLTSGRLSYPTTVVIPTYGSTPQAVAGYLKPADIEIFLKFFGDGRYGKERFELYRKRFKPSW